MVEEFVLVDNQKIDETGLTWDESLPNYQQGRININFYNNIVGYTAGDCVSGTVDVEIDNEFDANIVTL